MSLFVIGAGFGRTGTSSMKAALEWLGLGPCHHMTEVEGPEQTRYWRDAAQGRLPDWDDVFAAYRSCVDWPSAYFWRELSEFYPHAKIVLTVRDPESWYASMEKTIFKVLKASTDPWAVASKLIGEKVFQNRFEDKEHAITVYRRNNADVQAAFGPDRLLTYEMGSGWEPLCAFLDKPVPNVPFPHSNTTEDFADRLSGRR